MFVCISVGKLLVSRCLNHIFYKFFIFYRLTSERKKILTKRFSLSFVRTFVNTIFSLNPKLIQLLLILKTLIYSNK